MSDIFVFVVVALSASAFIKGALGLGFSTIALAILANVLDLKTAISIVLLPSLISNLVVMLDAGHFRTSIRQFLWLFVMTIPGMLLGLFVLHQNDQRLSINILALVLIMYGIWGLLNRPFSISHTQTFKLNPIIGVLTGCVNGATGSQIFPIMPYLLSLDIDKDQLVQVINLSFTLSSCIMLVSLLVTGSLDTKSILTYSLGIIPVTIGVWLGNKVRKTLSEELFKRLVMILLIILGVLLLLPV